MTKVLSGQVAMVTGASRGLGAHFARLLAAHGAAVALAARRAERVQALADEITAAGGRALALSLDVADAHAIGPALDQVEARLGPLGIMVNNAGVGGEGLALEQSIEEIDQIFDVNLRAVFIGAREAARADFAQRESRAGFPNQLKPDSTWKLVKGASLHGATAVV